MQKTWSWLPLTSPEFNFREIAKQLLLLEDHLAHPNKGCPDCIRKHLLTAEALADEASALGATKQQSGICRILQTRTRQWAADFVDLVEKGQDHTKWEELGQEVREFRKILTTRVFDPRESANRVAALYTARKSRQ